MMQQPTFIHPPQQFPLTSHQQLLAQQQQMQSMIAANIAAQQQQQMQMQQQQQSYEEPPLEQEIDSVSKQQIRQLIDEWREIDDALKEAAAEMKEWRKKKKEKEEMIMKIISGEDIELDYANERIVAENKKSAKGLNKDYIYQEIRKTLRNDEVAKQCVDNIYEHREVVERQVINRKKLGARAKPKPKK